MAIVGIIVGLIAAGIPWSWSRTAKHVPKIHDISTDTADPPQFSAVLPLRKDAENPAAYGGPDVAARQNQAYPDIQPLVMPMQPEAAFNRAVWVARDMAWDIVYMNAQEAGSKRRQGPSGSGSRTDDRTCEAGEGGKQDRRAVALPGGREPMRGTNANRVRTFLEK